MTAFSDECEQRNGCQGDQPAELAAALAAHDESITRLKGASDPGELGG